MSSPALPRAVLSGGDDVPNLAIQRQRTATVFVDRFLCDLADLNCLNDSYESTRLKVADP
jgi:hypothetical protein